MTVGELIMELDKYEFSKTIKVRLYMCEDVTVPVDISAICVTHPTAENEESIVVLEGKC